MRTETKQTALVTGASSGIGAEMARVLAAQGYDLILVARRKERLEKLSQELIQNFGISAVALDSDLCRPEAPQEVCAELRRRRLTVDVLVNNAGFGMKGEFIELDPGRTEDMIRLNITALTLLTRLIGEDMKRRGSGRILLVSSVGAFQPSPFFAVYSATKAYVLSFGEALAYELKPYGVTVTTVYPGVTATEFFAVSDFQPKKIMLDAAMTPRSVAEAAIGALFKGRVAAIPGLMNKLNALLVRSVPRSWATAFIGRVMKSLG